MQHPTINAEINALQQQIDALDLPGKISREAHAIEQYATFSAANAHRSSAIESVRLEQLALTSERTNAVAQRESTERDIHYIQRDINRRTELSTAETRVKQGQNRIDAAIEQVNEARAAVDAASATLAELARLVAAEEQAFTQVKTKAAAAMLAQIKSGTGGKVQHANRMGLDTLLLAHEAAAAELASAQNTLAQCEDVLAEAKQAQAQAHADCTAYVLHFLARDYAQALYNHEAATYACGQHFDAPDLDSLVRRLAISNE